MVEYHIALYLIAKKILRRMTHCSMKSTHSSNSLQYAGCFFYCSALKMTQCHSVQLGGATSRTSLCQHCLASPWLGFPNLLGKYDQGSKALTKPRVEILMVRVQRVECDALEERGALYNWVKTSSAICKILTWCLGIGRRLKARRWILSIIVVATCSLLSLASSDFLNVVSASFSILF